LIRGCESVSIGRLINNILTKRVEGANFLFLSKGRSAELRKKNLP